MSTSFALFAAGLAVLVAAVTVVAGVVGFLFATGGALVLASLATVESRPTKGRGGGS